MMEKDKVLPLVGELTGTFDDGRVYSRMQRDADWLVLQRDYVPREQLEGLVRTLKAIAKRIETFAERVTH